MAPYKVNLPDITRGDVRELAIALVGMGPVVKGFVTRIPLPAADVALLASTYTLIECQFRQTETDATALIDLSSAKGELQFQASARLPDGTTGPAVIIKLSRVHTAVVRSELVWDMQFSGPGVGPYTLFYGDGWNITQDRTRTATDSP